MKEPYLAESSVRFLETQSFTCESIAAGSEEDGERVRMLLAANQYDLVLAQQRMSPYSAMDLLDDAWRVTPAERPAVVCLAYDDLGHNTFIRSGGAGFKVLEPGDLNLSDVIAVLLREAEEYRRSRSASRMNILEKIDRYTSEESFQLLLIRVFNELGFLGVRKTHGLIEKGRDIVCWEVNKLGRREYVGVQVKLGDVDASGGKSSITELCRQSYEAFRMPVAFPDGKHYLDKFVIASSGRINEFAREKLVEMAVASHIEKPLYFLGREEVADTIVALCPTLAMEMGR